MNTGLLERRWSIIHIIKDGDNLKTFVNGIPDFPFELNLPDFQLKYFQFGSITPNTKIQMKIDNIKIYSRTLFQYEIEASSEQILGKLA